jgi:hypothetical protein
LSFHPLNVYIRDEGQIFTDIVLWLFSLFIKGMNMDSRQIKMILGVIAVIVIALILYSMYERNKDEMGGMQNRQGNSMSIPNNEPLIDV